MPQRLDPVDSNPRRGPWLVLGVVLALLVGAEAVSRVTVAPSRLDFILDLLERDAVLLWRLRPGLDVVFEGARVRTNAQHLRGPAFAANKPAGTRRVVCLGASPTFGWGVEEASTYPARLAVQLADAGHPVEVLNGGVPGYTSWQGLNWLRREVLAWRPDLVTIAYDLNDLDIFRFFGNNGRPDAEQRPVNRLVVAAQNGLNRSWAYRGFRRAVMGLRAGRGAFDPEALPRRVPPAQYEKNLRDIVATCRERAVAVVLLKMPIHLPFHKLTIVNPDAAKRERDLGREAAKRRDWAAARTHYDRARELDPTVVGLYAESADVARRLGDDAAADELLSFIPFAAAFRDRVDLRYNRLVEEVAAATPCPLVDVVAAFAADPRGDGLWNSPADPFHPNAAGHEIIAGALRDVVVTALAEGAK